MIERCGSCPIHAALPCLALGEVCERIAVDPLARSTFLGLAARYLGVAEAAAAADSAPMHETIAALRVVNRCLYRSTEGCGCSGARCGLSGRTVTHHQCLDCVRRYGES